MAGFAQEVNKRSAVAASEPEAVATGQRFSLRIVAYTPIHFRYQVASKS